MQSILDHSDEETETFSLFEEQTFLRVQTAPAKPVSDLDDFKKSQEFIYLEQAFICQSHLLQKDFQLYDLDSLIGQRICKKYLQLLEKMVDIYDARVSTRTYRNDFSKAYKILYKQDKLCYLTEILDSAQEGFPYLWVNGQKYVFSPEVLETGNFLMEMFQKVQYTLGQCYSKVLNEQIDFSQLKVKNQIRLVLEEFDFTWVTFEKVFKQNNLNIEQLYVIQLMRIEQKARSLIREAIELDKELKSIEIREKIKGTILMMSEDYIELKRKLCMTFARINGVANQEGKGRDDLGYEILVECESVLRRITREQSKAVRKIGEKIKQSFERLRELMRKYDQNIEMVDPQLKNNSDLVELLLEYEQSWEKGLNYFLQRQKCNQLIYFSHIIETTQEKYQQFRQQIEERDADIFLVIPCLLIIKYLENDDKKICTYFLPQLEDKNSKENKTMTELQSQFKEWKSQNPKFYQYYNILEKLLLFYQLNHEEQQILQKYNITAMVQKIKSLAMEIQRYNANEWNQFIDAAINYS